MNQPWYAPVPINPQTSTRTPMTPRQGVVRKENRGAKRPGILMYFRQGQPITAEEHYSLPVGLSHAKRTRRPESWKRVRKTQWRPA